MAVMFASDNLASRYDVFKLGYFRLQAQVLTKYKMNPRKSIDSRGFIFLF